MQSSRLTEPPATFVSGPGAVTSPARRPGPKGPEAWVAIVGATVEPASLDTTYEHLQTLVPSQVDVLLPRLPHLLPTLDNYGASDVAVACLKYAFHPGDLPVSRRELSAVQLGLLKALVRDTNVVHTDKVIKNVIENFVGDNDIKKLARYLRPGR
ncbi:MAG: hypothetical protein CVU63_05915 [Deltaproteobacteria bacterium HGW-Deltaproteobacteria-20]|nr:MAG: hypothetical protein CVU63_05915 [Deltaproteobacteria bacterium HGW-Deltaproteobacteria-20]